MAAQWIDRRGTAKSRFRYESAKGTLVRDKRALERIDALRIPPAWSGVRIAANARAAVQAYGFDAKGRKQYRYHDRAVERRELRKHYRVRQMAHDLPEMRQKLTADFRRRGMPRERVSAAVVRLISEGFLRVGSERYAKENKTFGITTLRKTHVRAEGDCVIFTYVGKRSIEQRQVVVDPSLARFIATLLKAPGRRLFRYQTGGGWCDLNARDVNDYLHDRLGVPYTAKDFRTWGGTLRAATVLADLAGKNAPESERQRKKDVVTAVRLVAAELGNTPTICRASYVHPLVIARYIDEGETIAQHVRGTRSAASSGQAPEERALIRFLDQHFPERRSKARSDDSSDDASARR